MKLKHCLTALSVITAWTVSAQIGDVHGVTFPEMSRTLARRIITLPEIEGYQILKCDFHTHTAYSDGTVWPDFRIAEAWTEGLDAVAITDHLRAKQPNPNAVGNENKPGELAEKMAQEWGILLIKGAEISKGKSEGGHINALFITDATKVNRPSAVESVEEAVKQGAFIVWNHPGWKDTCRMYPVNEKLIKEGKIHGVEVFNSNTWYPRALSWTRDLNLAPFANTDEHFTTRTVFYDPILRPMTLVFAKERSLKGIREALDARRTVAFFNGHLAGSPELLTLMVKQILSFKQLFPITEGREMAYEATNNTSIPVWLEVGHELIRFDPHSVTRLELPIAEKKITGTIVNFHTYENQDLTYTIEL